jgi:hypothetical protein
MNRYLLFSLSLALLGYPLTLASAASDEESPAESKSQSEGVLRDLSKKEVEAGAADGKSEYEKHLAEFEAAGGIEGLNKWALEANSKNSALKIEHGPPGLGLGNYDSSQITSVVNMHLSPLRACYDKGLRTSPDLTGEATIKFVIDSDGSVKNAATTQSTLSSAPVEECLVKSVLKMRFPPVPGGGIYIVRAYPLRFALAK